MLNIIQGKPGSGKSYFAIKKIVDLLINLVEDEKRTGKASVRRVYTNIKIIDFELDDYVERVTCSGIHASKYVTFLDNDFFWETGPDGNKALCFWWEKFSDGAFIVIDEVQYYLASNSKDNKADNYNKEFELYISTHRHKAQDILFITQHQDNILRSCLSMSEGTYIITNYKNFVLPILGIPFSDFDVVRHAFGNDYQCANVQYGLFVGRAFHKQSNETLLLQDDIFKLYKSHNQNIDSDRPNLNLTRFQAVFWLVRRHALQLSIKLIILITVCILLYSTFRAVPRAICSLFGNTTESVTESPKSTDTVKPITKDEKKVVVVADDYVILSDGSQVKIGESFTDGDSVIKLLSVDLSAGSYKLQRSAVAESEGR